MEKIIDSTPATKVMIVDDEFNARNRLVDLLSDISSYYHVEIVGEAQNGIEALKMLESLKVDVILCDITMPKMDGLEFSRHAKYLNKPPKIIFVTAYDDYAIQAFEVHAIDYLVKPVRTQRLFEALKRVNARTDSFETAESFPEVQRRYFNCSELGRMILVPVHTVCYIKSDDKYIQAVSLERDYWINDTLGNIEKEFSDLFLRVHRSYLVAKKSIVSLEKKGNSESNYSLQLANMTVKIPVSRRQLSAIKDYMKKASAQLHH